jgi:hypothetical protein
VLATWQLVHNDVKTAISKGEVMTLLTWLMRRSKTRCCQRVSYLLVTTTCDWNVSLYHKRSLLYLIQIWILHPPANYMININTGSYCLDCLWCTKNLICTASSLSFVITTFLSLCAYCCSTFYKVCFVAYLCDKAKTLLPRIKQWWNHRLWVPWEILCTRLMITSKILGMLNKIMFHCVLYKNWGCVCRSAQVYLQHLIHRRAIDPGTKWDKGSATKTMHDSTRMSECSHNLMRSL